MANIIYYFGYSGQVDEFKKWQLRVNERFPFMGANLGGLFDPVFGQENSNARAHLEGLRRAAWDRIVRESREVRLPWEL